MDCRVSTTTRTSSQTGSLTWPTVKLIIDKKTLPILSNLEEADANDLCNTHSQRPTPPSSTSRTTSQPPAILLTRTLLSQRENLRICKASMLQFSDHFARKLSKADTKLRRASEQNDSTKMRVDQDKYSWAGFDARQVSYKTKSKFPISISKKT